MLESFSKCRNWPDFMHSLEKLGAIYQSYPQGSIAVPAKHTVAKRLAQGCSASTPTVHQKVVELYRTMIERADALPLDMPLFGLGLFPLFENGDASVRLSIVNIVSCHLVPLGPELTPCIDGLVSALLSALVDMSTDIAPQVSAI